jgi:peptidyl-prolyl cis-trans isomerase SurA
MARLTIQAGVMPRLEILTDNVSGKTMFVATMMKKAIVGSLACLMLSSLAHAAELDRVVAVVNDEVITASELSTRVAQAERQLTSQGTALPAAGLLRRQVLDRMVLDRVQLQYAKNTGITVDDPALDKALQRIAENNKMTIPELSKAVEREQFTWPQFRENIRSEIMMSRLREREIEAKVTVSQGEVDAVLAASATEPKAREYQVEHILLRVPDGASADQIKTVTARADDLMRQIKQGEDFAKLAVANSASPDAMQGGMIDWRPLSRMPTIFAQAIPGMRNGEVSQILRSSAGFHIFKLMNSREANETKVEVEQTHARHILIRNGDGVDEARVRLRLNEIISRLRNGGDFAELAKSNSADITAAKGGDLGWLSPGDAVPEFERAMNGLKPGQVSDVVASPFGWHVIQVLERKKVDVTADQRKMEARQSLRERKSDEAYDNWLRQIRDSAWVDIRPE